MQKGLLESVKDVLPNAHHRFCMRHIESNWCSKWRGGQLKKLMWWCAWSCYEEEFKDMLRQMGKLSETAVKDLLHYPTEKNGAEHTLIQYAKIVWWTITLLNLSIHGY
ncbi:protein FAR1-RELATED SEQUENCE 4-like [Canna indica]|uniref:Protein FAR1-RELATED SEQUENCE 4-like n=1 Tax=Canna indica TaxID=4628 RepID=A0AAQ3Q2X1_9LILI|nr:protein FAR1-RELATED SEQUENCE 4-like [Canna indica]